MRYDMSEPFTPKDIATTEITTRLENQAKRARQKGNFFFYAIIIIVYSLILLFVSDFLDETDRRIDDLKLSVSSLTSKVHAMKTTEGVDSSSFSGRFSSEGSNAQSDQFVRSLILGDQKVNLSLYFDYLKLNASIQEVQLSKIRAESLTRTIISAFTKIGAVLIALYLVRILQNLMRYHYRLADSLISAVNALSASSGNIEECERYQKIFSGPELEPAANSASDDLVEVFRLFSAQAEGKKTKIKGKKSSGGR